MERKSNNVDEDMLSRAATWFAGYAVVRWHLGYELGDLYVEPDGLGEWLAPEQPIVVSTEFLPAEGAEDDEDAPPFRNPDGTINKEFLEACRVPPALEEEIRAQLEARKQSAPKPYEIVMMDMAAHVGEYGEAIPRDTSAWPTSWLDNARKFFTPPYCQTAFERPMNYNEAVLYCLEQARTVLDQYALLYWYLARELFGRFMRGELEISGPEITDLLHQWRADEDTRDTLT